MGKTLRVGEQHLAALGMTSVSVSNLEGREKMKRRRYCLALDLKNDPALIAEYRKYHERIWPEVEESISGAGILDLEIYLLGTRMCMVMEVDETFSFEKKAAADAANPKVREWEELMWKFQKAVPEAGPGEKWVRMERIFRLEDSPKRPEELGGAVPG